jgi:hypothetical protein
MMDLLTTKTGSKFILTENFVESPKRWVLQPATYPKNLVISLVSLKLNINGITGIFKLISAKPIREKYYQGIDEKIYSRRYYSCRRFHNEDLRNLLAIVAPFDQEYKDLTTRR